MLHHDQGHEQGHDHDQGDDQGHDHEQGGSGAGTRPAPDDDHDLDHDLDNGPDHDEAF